MVLDFHPYNVDVRLRAAVEEVCDTEKRVRSFGGGGTAIWTGYVYSVGEKPAAKKRVTDISGWDVNWAGVARLEYTNAENGGVLYDRDAPSLAEELEAIKGLQRVLDDLLVPSAATEPNDDKETPGA